MGEIITSSAVVEMASVQVPFPLHTFPVQDRFVWRHEQGTLIEMENEIAMLKQHNDRRTPFEAYPIAPLPGHTTAFAKSWLMLVKIQSGDDVMLPCIGDSFCIDMEATVEREEGVFSLIHLPASRIPNPYENTTDFESASMQNYAAFKVDVPRSWRTKDGQDCELDLMGHFQIATGVDDTKNISLTKDNCQVLTIRYDTSSQTFDAELAALRCFTEPSQRDGQGPSEKSRRAFKMIQSFNECDKVFENLHEIFPHLKRPAHPRTRIPTPLVDMFRAFNDDHRSAFRGLKSIPNGLYFINGCPGSGKTWFNTVLAALIQSRGRPGSRRRHSPILFLVDINKTVDDAANRYFQMCKSVGLGVRVVRMHGFPYEMRNSEKLSKSGSSPLDNEELNVDFTKKFLTTANLARHTTLERDENKAPTLDEAAWEHYELHQDDCFPELKALLARMDAGEAFSNGNWRALRGQVTRLYKVTLAKTDFIATTPVAAYGPFSQYFRPEIIFIDEAPHARELTTLIPVAYFDPFAWIFTGDVKQTQPFVRSDRPGSRRDGLKPNPFCEQLQLSTMARAEKVRALNARLLVNKRAYGNLERLPSKIFYESKMTSAFNEGQKYPPSTLHLKRYLERLGGVDYVSENRVIVRLKDSKEETLNSSFWNPTHHKWLLGQVQALLRDAEFRSATDASQPGTIMIETPYRSASRQYQTAVRVWPEEWQGRVEVLTVDKAQGNQADAVFLDMVRTTTAGFMDNPKRLNVALTRARQAEVILMHHRMTTRSRGQLTEYTSEVWDDAMVGRRVFTLS